MVGAECSQVPHPQVGQALVKPHVTGESPEADLVRKKGPPHGLKMVLCWSLSHGKATLILSVKAWQGSWRYRSQYRGAPPDWGSPECAALGLVSSSSAAVWVFPPHLAPRGLTSGRCPRRLGLRARLAVSPIWGTTVCPTGSLLQQI